LSGARKKQGKTFCGPAKQSESEVAIAWEKHRKKKSKKKRCESNATRKNPHRIGSKKTGKHPRTKKACGMGDKGLYIKKISQKTARKLGPERLREV